eukprot:Hpha_TRINITY_DN791_c0_g1::TRINITY_DN791_c0_g1_i2::g.28903::m.28903
MEWHSQVSYPLCNKFIGIKGWGGYTWNSTLFADPVGFVETLHNVTPGMGGIHLALNYHPDGQIDGCQAPYAAMAAALGIAPPAALPDLDVSQLNRTFCDAYFTHAIEATRGDIAWTDTPKATTWSNYLYVRYPALRRNKRTINFSRYGG